MPHWSTLRAQRGCTRRETLDVLSARPDFCHISMRHTRVPRKSRRSPVTRPRSTSSSPRGRETQADDQIISVRVYRTALRHPVVSTSNAKSVEVREDASESSCPQSQFDREEAHRLQVLQAVNEERDAVTGLSSASLCTACTEASASCRTAPSRSEERQ